MNRHDVAVLFAATAFAKTKVACSGDSGRSMCLGSFGAGFGEANDVHPRNKIPFAEFAAKALGSR